MISISLFVVLLATYCYSVPVTDRFDITTPEYEFTTGKTIIDHENKINMHLVTDEESTGLPDIHKVREVMMGDNDKMKPSEHHDEHYGEHYDNDKHHEHHENHEHKTRTAEESNETDVEKEERSIPMDNRYSKDPSRSNNYEHGERHGNDRYRENHDRHGYKTRTTEESNESDVQKEERSDPVDKRYTNDYRSNNYRHNDNYRNRDNYNRYRTREFDETTELNTATPSSDIHTDLNEFLFTTMETKTHFEKKAIPSHESDSFVMTSTTDKNVHIDENRVNPKEHTSGDSFGHMTGLLKTRREEEEETPEAKREEEEKSETKREEEEKSETKREEEEKSETKREEEEEKPEAKREEEEEKPEAKREEERKFVDRSFEGSTTPLTGETTKIVKTETITPTKIIGQKQPMDEKKKSDN